MDEKTRFIQQLDQARETMRAVLAEIDTQMEVYPGWTIKPVLAHLAGWDDASIASLRAHAGGQEPATPAVRGINFYNAQSVATREALSYEQTVKEWELSREQLKAAILDLPPEKLDEPMLFAWGRTGTVAQLVEIFASHEEEHAEEIGKLLKARIGGDHDV
jgi:hypothetical protein